MLRFITEQISRTWYMVMALLILAVPTLIHVQVGVAAPLQDKRVILATSEPSAATSHTFNFRIPTTGNVGSIVFQYCDNSPFVDAPCTAPTGLDVSSFAIDSQNGATGFSPHANTNSNNIYLTRAPSAVTGPQDVSYTLSNISNPSLPRYSVYVRIKVFASADGSGPYTDEGSVVFSTDGQLNTGGFVPPYITFCVGVQVSDDCSSVTGFNVDLGELNPEITSTGTSQFAVATNYPSGYLVFVSGTTLTSGNNIIPNLSTPAQSRQGESQFGLNLRSNTDPAIGSAKTGTGVATAQPTYNINNLFRYEPGTSVARSLKPTEFNRFTVSYIANVSEDQEAGVYNTTLQYTATAQF